MSFLTLAQGDSVGKGLLKKLLSARYGASPPALDTLRIHYEGKSRARLGPIPLWANVKATSTYRFPDRMKWEFHVKVLRVFNSSYSTAFDGTTVYEYERGQYTHTTDPDIIRSAQLRVWSETVFFISPLMADERVRVEKIEDDPHSFRAYAPDSDDVLVTVHLREGDGQLDEIELKRYNSVDRQTQLQRLRARGELTRVDGLIMPQTLERYWEDELQMALTPVQVELNPALTEADFRLEKEDLLAILHEDEEADEDDAEAVE
jgi:hypothetical protein